MIGAAANAFSNQTGIVANVSIIGSVIFIGQTLMTDEEWNKRHAVK